MDTIIKDERIQEWMDTGALDTIIKDERIQGTLDTIIKNEWMHECMNYACMCTDDECIFVVGILCIEGVGVV